MRERSTTLLSRVNSKELWLGLSNHLDTKRHSQHRVPSTNMNDIKLALLGSEGAGKSGKCSSYIVYSPYILYAYVSFRLTKTLQHLFLPMCLLHGPHILSWKSSMCERCVRVCLTTQLFLPSANPGRTLYIGTDHSEIIVNL